jgi:hypothetical protein
MSLKLGGLHEKHAVATWNLGTISAFASRQRKTKKTCVEMAGRRTLKSSSKCYLRIQSVPQREPPFTITKINWLILLKEIIAVYT